MVERMAKTTERGEADMDSLVRNAKVDSGSFGELYDIYYRRILNYCRHRLFNGDIAEDVTSKVFLAVASQIKAFKGKTEQEFGSWIYTIASNKINDHLRKTTRRNRILLEAANTLAKEFADDQLEQGLNWPSLYRGIASLKTQEQTIVTLRFFEGLSYEQISAITGIKSTTVGVRIHRILKKLRNHLQKLVDGGV